MHESIIIKGDRKNASKTLLINNLLHTENMQKYMQ